MGQSGDRFAISPTVDDICPDEMPGVKEIRQDQQTAPIVQVTQRPVQSIYQPTQLFSHLDDIVLRLARRILTLDIRRLEAFEKARTDASSSPYEIIGDGRLCAA